MYCYHPLEMSKKDRDHLRQKYANAKNNFTIVVVRSEINSIKELEANVVRSLTDWLYGILV